MSVTKPDLMPLPFANSGLKNTIPISPPGGADINQASYDAGFPPTTMTPIVSGGKPPKGRDMNGILYDTTSHIQYQNAGGQYWFDEDFAAQIGGYPLGAVLQSNDGKSSYVSIIDNNTTDFNTDSSSIGEKWAVWAGEAAQGSKQYFAHAAGTSEVITATFNPPITAINDGMVVGIEATAANASANPSFNPDGLGALTIVKGVNVPLDEGDIGGEGYLAFLQYSGKWNKWILQNPAKGIDVSTGVPVGTVVMFAASTAPAGYLIANGAAVGRATYPDLFAAIGTLYGEGDGETTFNLPDLIGRFAEGSETPGTVKEAGLPNIEGSFTLTQGGGAINPSGAFANGAFVQNGIAAFQGSYPWYETDFSAEGSNPIYGASDTVQPPALTLLPCIKAFDATVNSGLINVTELAQEMAGKVDKVISGKNTAYIVDSYRDEAGNWWRKWSDGWLEQGGNISITEGQVTFLAPFGNNKYAILTGIANNSASAGTPVACYYDKTSTSVKIQARWNGSAAAIDRYWYACGQGGQS